MIDVDGDFVPVTSRLLGTSMLLTSSVTTADTGPFA